MMNGVENEKNSPKNSQKIVLKKKKKKKNTCFKMSGNNPHQTRKFSGFFCNSGPTSQPGFTLPPSPSPDSAKVSASLSRYCDLLPFWGVLIFLK